MSYGKEYKLNGKTYLIEKFDKHISVSEKLDEENYKDIFVGNYEDLFDSDELWQLSKINDYDHALYCMFIFGLDGNGVIDIYSSYKAYVCELLKSGISREDILTAKLDEKHAYSIYYPLDKDFTDFKRVTNDMIRELTKIIYYDDLRRQRIEVLKKEWNCKSIDYLIIKFNNSITRDFKNNIEMYISNIDLLEEFMNTMSVAGYSSYHDSLNDGGYILRISL